jgi:hypothetical protein
VGLPPSSHLNFTTAQGEFYPNPLRMGQLMPIVSLEDAGWGWAASAQRLLPAQVSNVSKA